MNKKEKSNYDKNRYKNNREFLLEQTKKYQENNKEKISDYHRIYNKINSKKNKKYQKEYYNTHKKETLARYEKRRAIKLGAEGTYTEKEWKDCLELFDYRCAFCGEKIESLTKEHLVPLSRKGRNDASNIVPACISCNKSKYNKTLLEFLIYRQRI